jgi:predicted nuclease of predicted toxin-antitoxin system
MKILVDMNLSPAWVPFLAGAGIVAVHWSTVGDPRATDRALMTWAHEGGYVIFTHDLDFGTLLAIVGATGPSVLQVRTLDILPSAIGADVLRVLEQHSRAVLPQHPNCTIELRCPMQPYVPGSQVRVLLRCARHEHQNATHVPTPSAHARR